MIGFSNSISPSNGRFPFLCLALVPGLIRGSSSFAGSVERTGLVTENVKRVAATAEQILEILNRNTGLLVELKHWIAQDAGESSRVLEESLTAQASRGWGCDSPANLPGRL